MGRLAFGSSIWRDPVFAKLPISPKRNAKGLQRSRDHATSHCLANLAAVGVGVAMHQSRMMICNDELVGVVGVESL